MTDGTQMKSLPTVYDPKSVEHRIYEFWEHGGYFEAGRDPSKPPFSIVMPPPNVTGSLHLGHAWDNTLQDIVIRFKRMTGYDALWVPGTDHAGIATQTRVEKALLADEGLTRHDIGREAFVERVWAWKNAYGSTITTQLRALGVSCDWSRERFTMDQGLSKAVREVFVRLYHEGLIYRGNRIINWCPRCSTALSDIEVEHTDVTGKLYYVRYPLVDGSGGLTVATSRPETMFADVAVAVHPNDERYQSLIGKSLRLPLTNQVIPIIPDAYVDPEFGTGCVKITPAHDPNDFEVGVRHQLEMPQCIDADGRLTELAGVYEGMEREEARMKVVQDLEVQGFLVKAEELVHAVGHCSRCETVVEPFLSLQWFVRMEPLADAALSAVHHGELRFVPDRFEKVFLNWLENVRDWCISRQLWWGHRIPAWYCDHCGQVTVANDEVTTCNHCGSTALHQDDDVLDTWFSSGLWPFSTMGWPEQTADLARYYPTSALMTGYDIIFFWVARMVFTGLKFTGHVPFADVVLHGLIRAADGRKMSKSLGNGVDPVEVINQYGADALRYTIATGTSPGNDQRFQWERVESSRNFINKIWNASRYVLMNLGDTELPKIEWETLGIADRWILHRLGETAGTVKSLIGKYEFGEAGRALYDFAWDEVCDWYIEFSKLALYGEDLGVKSQTQAVLVRVIDGLLRLLHPFIPFVTEEIWQALPVEGAALVAAAWPESPMSERDPQAVRQISIIREAIRSVRNLRADRNVPPSKPISMRIRCTDQDMVTLLQSVEPYLYRFCNLNALAIGEDIVVPERAVTAVIHGADIYLPLEDLVDLAEERNRLVKEREKLLQEVERVTKKLGNAQFVDKAPADVVAAERDKETEYRAKLAAVEERLGQL